MPKHVLTPLDLRVAESLMYSFIVNIMYCSFSIDYTCIYVLCLSSFTLDIYHLLNLIIIGAIPDATCYIHFSVISKLLLTTTDTHYFKPETDTPKLCFLYIFKILKDFCELLKLQSNIYKRIRLFYMLLVYGVPKYAFY